eukprot:352837-Chlamydomonas_euryale.AAC.2
MDKSIGTLSQQWESMWEKCSDRRPCRRHIEATSTLMVPSAPRSTFASYSKRLVHVSGCKEVAQLQLKGLIVHAGSASRCR